MMELSLIKWPFGEVSLSAGADRGDTGVSVAGGAGRNGVDGWLCSAISAAWLGFGLEMAGSGLEIASPFLIMRSRTSSRLGIPLAVMRLVGSLEPEAVVEPRPSGLDKLSLEGLEGPSTGTEGSSFLLGELRRPVMPSRGRPVAG